MIRISGHINSKLSHHIKHLYPQESLVVNSMRWLSPFFLALFLHSYCVRADQINVQDISSRDLPAAIHNGFIRLALHSSIRAGATIYIDGGEINFRGSIGGTGTGTVTLNNTLTLDLSKSWKPAEVPFQFIDKPPSTPVLNHGTLWPALDNQSIFSFGGVRSPFPSALRIQSVKLWKYSFSTGWLGLTSQSPVSPTLTNARPAAAAETHGKGIGYMLGGFRGNDHAPFWPLPGMLTYNMTDNSWTNESTTALTPFGTIGGSLTYVPGFGQDGILIAMGGEYTGSGPWTETASNLISFTNISIWDIASKTWYSQPATANTNVSDSTVNLPDIPTSVTTFCSAGIASQQGTYEIFVYGGYSNTFLLSSEVPSEADAKAQASLNGVYVLSLPSFTWTKVSSTGAASRTGHTCHVVGNRQMLSIGGLDPSKAINLSRNSLDPWQHGLGIFDMVDLKWKENYDVNAPAYVTPKIVSAWYESQ